MIIILCPVGFVTGGVELAHQLCHAINTYTDERSYIWYTTIKGTDVDNVIVDAKAPAEYSEYHTECITDYAEIDRPENVVVFPETLNDYMKLIDNAKKVLWWMSVDNYFLSIHVEMDYLAKNVSLHLFQSCYAKDFVEKNVPGSRGMYLSDYVNTDYISGHISPTQRENIALYNPLKGINDLKPLMEKANWIEWIPLKGFTRDQMISIMQKAKIYVDFGSHPGKDRIPREAAASGCCVITNKKGSAAYYEDIPIPDKYKFDNTGECLDEIDMLMHDICERFSEHQKDFEAYREMILSEKDKFFEGVKEFIEILEKPDKPKFNTLIITIPKDAERLLHLYPRLAENIDNGELCFVSSPEIQDILAKEKALEGKVQVIDENSIIPFSEVHSCIARRIESILAGRELPRGITGWYYQQFLKMQYAFLCEDEYYMVWDGDTIPCKKINMFQESTGRPYLDMKHEYHAEYFETMGVLFPGFHKVIERSFVSEHMLMKTDIMRRLVTDIENNAAICGDKFWEKIINAIPEDKIQSSAFSEFETYGTYCALRCPDVYALREWHSFRQGGTFFSIDTICDRDFNWLSHDFDAISFEKGHTVRGDNANLFDNPYYQERLTPKQMLQAAQQEYKEGYKEVWVDDKEIAKANTSSGDFGMSDDIEPESRLKYLDKNTYKLYEELGDKLFDINIDQAYLCYENAEFLCDEQDAKEIAASKKQKALDTGRVSVNKTAFVILSYNNTYFLQRCIESIYTNCNPDSYLLVIFENGSTDGTAEWLSEWGGIHDEALIILNGENLGFSGGNNAACQYVPEGYDIFYLNNDTRVPANALFWLRMGLYSSKDVGGAGAVQNYAITDQLEEVEFGAPEQYVEYGARVNVPMDEALEEQTKLCGFAMFIKRKAYDKTGGFDEAFSPGYLEDDDLSMQIRSLGYRLIVCHNAFIYHAGGQSFRKNNDVNSLFTEHRKILLSKWGFDTTIEAAMSKNELAFVKTLKEKGYTKDEHFTVLHVNCGCGNMLGHIHYLYPNAELYGVEKNQSARKYALPFIKIFESIDELPVEKDSFDVVAHGLG